MRSNSYITTDELAKRTAGGISYIRTKDGEIKGLALTSKMNRYAPNIVVVGKGKRIEGSARQLLAFGLAVPTYMKRDTNAWELVGNYRATGYKTDAVTIEKYRSNRSKDEVAGILFLEASA